MAFEVNQKVVAIHDFKGNTDSIIKDEIYSIKETRMDWDGLVVLLDGQKKFWHNSHFRPLQTQYNFQSSLMELAVTFKETIERSDCPVTKPEKIKA